MEYLNKNLAVNLKRIRKSKKMSLDIMAIETGVSKSMLGQIERGEANPSIATLGKIISGLRVSFTELVGPPREETFIVRKASLTPIKENPLNFKNFAYFPFEEDRNFEIYHLEVEPGGNYSCSSHGEKTMEYLVVFSGTLTLDLGKEKHVVSKGDAVRFASDKNHIYYNNEDEMLHVYMLFTWL